MNMMLSPDLLDRRALALIQLSDIFGRPVESPVEITGSRLRSFRKSGGRIAIIGAKGFSEYEAQFDPAPSSPAIGSRDVVIGITPSGSLYASRSFTLKLPRETNPNGRGQPQSIFSALPVTLLPGPAFAAAGSNFIVRAQVTRQSDGAAVENALLRGVSDDGKFAAMAVTDYRGEAALVFAEIPASFAGAGANVEQSIDGKVIVDTDPATVRFHKEEDIPAAALAASKRKQGHVDPHAMAAAIPENFGSGKPIKIAAGQSQSLAIKWS